MLRRRLLVIGGSLIGVYSVSLVYRSLSPAMPRVRLENDDPNYVPGTTEERLEVFERIARGYDRAMRFPAWISGEKAQRKALLKHARGKVLESGVGTGTNFQFFTKDVESVTAIDTSAAMLALAQAKYDGMVRGEPGADGIAAGPPLPSPPPASFTVMSAESLSLSTGSFDTVVDTHGLCSYGDPRAALSELVRATRTDGRGRILLLAHGRSATHEWLNTLLFNKHRSDAHVRTHGCDLDRDIDALVSELGSRVRVVERRTFAFGTAYIYVLAVPARRTRQASAIERDNELATRDAKQDR